MTNGIIRQNRVGADETGAWHAVRFAGQASQHSDSRPNGAGQLARGSGRAWLGRLAPNQSADIGIDAATLEDPQWLARKPELRIVPRAGTVRELDFALEITGEIDGSAYVLADGVRRPAGGLNVALEVELVDATGKVVATTTTTTATLSDGYYVLEGVAPGAYWLRIAPEQLARLGMTSAATHHIHMSEDGAFVHGKDFVLSAAREGAEAGDGRMLAGPPAR